MTKPDRALILAAEHYEQMVTQIHVAIDCAAELGLVVDQEIDKYSYVGVLRATADVLDSRRCLGGEAAAKLRAVFGWFPAIDIDSACM